MYCMELLIPESGREGWDYERRGNEKQLFKELPGIRKKTEDKAEPAAESKAFADFFLWLFWRRQPYLEWCFMMPLW